MATKKGFVGSLVDFSFSSFVAPRIVGVIYGLSILGVGLAVLGVGVSAFFSIFQGNVVVGLIRAIGVLIISLVVAIVYLLFIRVGLEGLVAGIVTAENTNEIKEYVRQIRNEKP